MWVAAHKNKNLTFSNFPLLEGIRNAAKTNQLQQGLKISNGHPLSQLANTYLTTFTHVLVQGFLKSFH